MIVAFLGRLFKLAMIVPSAIVGICFLLYFAFVAVLWLNEAYRAIFVSPRYAEHLFGPILAYDKVLASRPQYEFGMIPVLPCAYAAVLLPAGAENIPPVDKVPRKGSFQFNVEWHPTPVAVVKGTQENTLDFCLGLFDRDAKVRLKQAMVEPGSWYWIGNGRAFVYSAPHRIVAWMSEVD